MCSAPPAAISAWARLTPDGVDENTGILLGYGFFNPDHLRLHRIGHEPEEFRQAGEE